MADELRHECGVAALCALDDGRERNVAAMMPGILLDLQARGQLAAGFSTYDRDRPRIIETYKGVGTVGEVFRTSHAAKHAALMEKYKGSMAIGHTRYATTGGDDVNYAQPFERIHGQKWKWFSFAFNGTLSNYAELRESLIREHGYHFLLDTDTEIIMYALAHQLRGEIPPEHGAMMSALAKQFDGSYSMAYMDAAGRLLVARDPLGLRPMSWAVEDGIIGAASESMALQNAGFRRIEALKPGEMLLVQAGKYHLERFADAKAMARCFFEWVYFSNVGSEIDGVGVYQSRTAAGRRLAELEDQRTDERCVVVPVPDTAKAAADAFAHRLSLPSVEGIVRNRYLGRSFIQPSYLRTTTAGRKYSTIPALLRDRRVFLIEDSLVRATTLRVLAKQLKVVGGAAEVHVRVACPPIVSPCFYGIDMANKDQLFATRYAGASTTSDLQAMSEELGVDSLRYLPVSDLGAVIGVPQTSLCLGCVSGCYPTPAGNRLVQIGVAPCEGFER
jgi:amidophosphoribosyltransferase